MNKANAFLQSLLKSPILWGGAASFVFYSLIHSGVLGHPLVRRYCTNHPVEYAETTLFFVGLALLVLKTIDILGQYPGLRQSPLGGAPRTTSAGEEACEELLTRLDRLPEARQAQYYPRRLRMAIEHVARCGSAADLEDELKYLADLDASRLHTSYGLFRVIVWAIPILGFLGTVIGITIALNGLRPEALDESMVGVITGLGVKFDTTALALSLAMVLMFVHFFVDRADNNLLDQVDIQVKEDLGARFTQITAGPDGQLVAVRRMAEIIVQSTERLVQRQAELWQASLDAAASRWTHMADTAAEQVRKGLTGAMAEGLKAHAQQLAATEQSAAEQNRRHWEKIQQTETQHVQALAAIETGMTRQAEILGRAVEASGEVSRLQDVLNRNLAALAGAKHFEQTVMSLAAAIHLLNARLADGTTEPLAIQLEPVRHRVQAA